MDGFDRRGWERLHCTLVSVWDGCIVWRARYHKPVLYSYISSQGTTMNLNVDDKPSFSRLAIAYLRYYCVLQPISQYISSWYIWVCALNIQWMLVSWRVFSGWNTHANTAISFSSLERYTIYTVQDSSGNSFNTQSF